MAETRYICKHSDGMGHCNISDDGYCSGPCTLEKDIEYSPVVHGRWRFCGSDRWNDVYECDNCGKMATNNSDFCPNCGANMDGGEQDA